MGLRRRRDLRDVGRRILEAVIGRGQRGIGAQSLRGEGGLGAVIRLAQDVDGGGFQPTRTLGVLGGRGRLHGALEVAAQAALLVLDRKSHVHAEAHHRAAAPADTMQLSEENEP